MQEIGATPQTLLFAKVEQVYLDDRILNVQDDRLTVDALTLDPLSRLGGGEYATLEKTFTIQRPH